MNKRLVALTVALALIPGVASAHPSAIATGHTANETWTMGHVDNITVTMDGCGPPCDWAALAGTAPAANYCPQDWSVPGTTQFQAFWAAANSTLNETVQSGPRDFSLNGAAGQRLCVYVEQTFSNGARHSYLLYSPLIPQAAAPIPPPVTPDTACADARAELAAAKAKVKRLKQRDAKRQKIKRAKRKVDRARGAVDAVCPA